MEYKELLKKVKEENPELSHKEAMGKASELFQNLKKAQAGIDGEAEKTDPEEPKTGTIDKQTLLSAEIRIREIGVDINSIVRTGKEVMPEGEIKKHGMNGVNTLLTFEDIHGNRLPVEGHFITYI